MEVAVEVAVLRASVVLSTHYLHFNVQGRAISFALSLSIIPRYKGIPNLLITPNAEAPGPASCPTPSNLQKMLAGSPNEIKRAAPGKVNVQLCEEGCDTRS